MISEQKSSEYFEQYLLVLLKPYLPMVQDSKNLGFLADLVAHCRLFNNWRLSFQLNLSCCDIEKKHLIFKPEIIRLADNSKTPMSKTRFSEEQTQLPLDIREPQEKKSKLPKHDESLSWPTGIRISENIYNPKIIQIGLTSKWLNQGAAIAASILLFIVIFPNRNESQSTGITENFVGQEVMPVRPIERKLPVLEPVKRLATFQIGLFRQLKGAESEQYELTILGLSPIIRKKITPEGVMYALEISPKDETDRKLTLGILTSNNINYFKARGNGSQDYFLLDY